jgi:DNA-binding IclR family transcriptional regulator
MQLAHVWLKGLEVVTVARPIVEELRDRTGETAALFRLQEERGICILESESRHTLSISRGVGDALKINQGATGKAILAFMDEQRQKTFFASMPRNVNLAQLQKSLKATKRNGFAVSRGEIFAGAVAVASPYFDHRGSVAGSIGLYGPQARVDESKIILFGKLVDDAGRRVSALLGFQTSEL